MFGSFSAGPEERYGRAHHALHVLPCRDLQLAVNMDVNNFGVLISNYCMLFVVLL